MCSSGQRLGNNSGYGYPAVIQDMENPAFVHRTWESIGFSCLC